MTDHGAFDSRWRPQVDFGGKDFRRARTDAYYWLSRALGLPPASCHIGMMDVETCRRVVEVCSNAR